MSLIVLVEAIEVARVLKVVPVLWKFLLAGHPHGAVLAVEWTLALERLIHSAQ